MNQKKYEKMIEKFKTIRLYYDKIFITFAGSLWILSTLWDIYKLQRYWLDFSMEFYSSIFLFYMIIFTINPKSLPLYIYNSFSVITTIKGRGITLLLISSLFLRDKHAFHKFCAIILFIGGLLYLICEILVPTTKDELHRIESMFKNSKNIEINKAKFNVNIVNEKNQIDTTIQQFNPESTIIEKTEENIKNKNSNIDNADSSKKINNEKEEKKVGPYEIPIDEDF